MNLLLLASIGAAVTLRTMNIWVKKHDTVTELVRILVAMLILIGLAIWEIINRDMLHFFCQSCGHS